jgi:hypothetical protein
MMHGYCPICGKKAKLIDADTIASVKAVLFPSGKYYFARYWHCEQEFIIGWLQEEMK